MLSYMLLPDYANEGSLVDKKDLEAKYSVPNNVVALLFLPVYSAVMMSYQQDFLTSVAPLSARNKRKMGPTGCRNPLALP